MSRYQPAASKCIRSPRPGSIAKSSRSVQSRIVAACAASADQAASAIEEARLAVEPRDAAPQAVVHEDPRTPVDRRRAVCGERTFVQRRRIAAVRLEAVRRIVLGL